MWRNIFRLLHLYEYFWSFQKIQPHYSLVGRPFYKLLGGNKKPFLSVPATFFMMDLLFHQVFAQIAKDYKQNQLSADTLLKINLFQSLAWTSLSLPIAYYKHKKNKFAARLSSERKLIHSQDNKKELKNEFVLPKDTKYHDQKEVPKNFFKKNKKKKRIKEITDEQMANSVFGKKRDRRR